MDFVLEKILNYFKNNLKNYVKSCYLMGSYATKNFSSHSDIDLIFFCDGLKKDDVLELFNQTCEKNKYPIRVDARFIWIPDNQNVPVEIASAKLIWGENILSVIREESLKRYTTRIAQTICTGIGAFRQLPEQILSYPLVYPNCFEEYYGYSNQSDVRKLFNLNFNIARFFLSLDNKIITRSKIETYSEFKKINTSEWAEHIEEIFTICYKKLEYNLPTEIPDKSKLKKLCRKTLLFENLFLMTLNNLVINNSDLIYCNEFKNN